MTVVSILTWYLAQLLPSIWVTTCNINTPGHWKPLELMLHRACLLSVQHLVFKADSNCTTFVVTQHDLMHIASNCHYRVACIQLCTSCRGHVDSRATIATCHHIKNPTPMLQKGVCIFCCHALCITHVGMKCFAQTGNVHRLCNMATGLPTASGCIGHTMLMSQHSFGCGSLGCHSQFTTFKKLQQATQHDSSQVIGLTLTVHKWCYLNIKTWQAETCSWVVCATLKLSLWQNTRIKISLQPLIRLPCFQHVWVAYNRGNSLKVTTFNLRLAQIWGRNSIILMPKFEFKRPTSTYLRIRQDKPKNSPYESCLITWKDANANLCTAATVMCAATTANDIPTPTDQTAETARNA